MNNIVRSASVVLIGLLFVVHPNAKAAQVTAITNLETYYVTDESAVVTAQVTGDEYTQDIVEFGTEAGLYTDSVTDASYHVSGDARTFFLIHAPELHGESTYYYRIKIGGVVSSEGSFTTKFELDFSLDAISPTSGGKDTSVTITGKGFGDQKSGGVVYFGTCGEFRTREGCAEIVSWSDTKIVVKPVLTGSNPSVTGTIGVLKEVATLGSVRAMRLVKAFEGPTFTLTEEASTNTNTTEESTNSIAPDETVTTNTATNSTTNETVDTNAATAGDTTKESPSFWVTTFFWASVIGAAIAGFLLAYFFQKRKA